MSPDRREGTGSLAVRARIDRGGSPGHAPFTVQVDLAVRPGQTVALLGPNGAGKTTVLRAVAGLTPISAGQIVLGGRVLDDTDAGVFVPAAARRIGVVFQDYRLFPHLTVRDNVAFGPRRLGADRRQARAVADEWLDRLDLASFASSRPQHLSGGQQQRVALARALAAGPEAVLLDEPMAALDVRTRHEVRAGLREALARVAGPTVLVTHDPLDALVLADQIVVLEEGQVVQVGPPAEVARRPRTDYVARLVGLNLYHGRRTGTRIALDEGGSLVVPAAGSDGELVLLAVPPSAISVHVHRPDPTSVRNAWPGQIAGMQLLADRVRLQVTGPPSALVDVTPAAVADLGLSAGQQVWLAVKALEIEVYPTAPASPTAPESPAALASPTAPATPR